MSSNNLHNLRQDPSSSSTTTTTNTQALPSTYPTTTKTRVGSEKEKKKKAVGGLLDKFSLNFELPSISLLGNVEGIINSRTNDVGESYEDSPYYRRQLQQLAKRGEIKQVQKLVEAGVTPNFRDHEGKTALTIAADRKDTELVRTLMSSPKIDVNLKETTCDATPLIIACKFDSRDVVARKNIIDMILKSPRIDVNIQDREGYTALCYVSLIGDFDTVQKLLAANADVNSGNEVDGKVRTPLYYAKVGNHHQIANLLESKGAREFMPRKPSLPKGPIMKLRARSRSLGGAQLIRKNTPQRLSSNLTEWSVMARNLPTSGIGDTEEDR